MALERSFRVIEAHAASVVRNRDEAPAGFFDAYLDSSGSCVDRILYQLLDDA
jgi:hypothetical protein